MRFFTILAVGFLAAAAFARPVKEPNTDAGDIAGSLNHAVDGQGGYISQHLYNEILLPSGIKKATALKIYKESSHYIAQYKRNIELKLAPYIESHILPKYSKPYGKQLGAILKAAIRFIVLEFRLGKPALEAQLDAVLAKNLSGKPLSIVKAKLHVLLSNWSTKRLNQFCEKCTPAEFKGLQQQLSQ